MTTKLSLLSLILTGGVLTSCSDDAAGTRTLSVSLENLEELGDGYVYEGWVIVDGAPVSTGRFTDPSNVASVQIADEEISKFVLTIEPEPDNSPEPADTKVLGGDFASDTANLSIGDGAALGDDFSSAAGSFILATPSTASDDTDETQGIWFLNASGGTPASSLVLPTLPAGWAYEGWVVVNGSPISTGRFTDPAAADDDAGGSTAGSDGTPGFPGQDFITPPTDLVGGAAVISVEPQPDDSDAPFAFKPLLQGTIADQAGSQDLANNVTASAPAGVATIE